MISTKSRKLSLEDRCPKTQQSIWFQQEKWRTPLFVLYFETSPSKTLLGKNSVSWAKTYFPWFIIWICRKFSKFKSTRRKIPANYLLQTISKNCYAFLVDTSVVKYSLKALPCSIVWFRIIYELMVKDFEKDYQLD